MEPKEELIFQSSPMESNQSRTSSAGSLTCLAKFVLSHQERPCSFDANSDMPVAEVTNKFRERQTLAIKQGRTPIPMMTAQELHETSLFACQALTRSLVDGEKLDIEEHFKQVGKAIGAYRKAI